jgi:nucleoside 2-deoxyribosyltransferase
MHVFIAGLMQGSRRDHLINGQDYRERITTALRSQFPELKISDPYAMHPQSINYDGDQVRETFESLTAIAGQADLVIAYLPEASMGTAIEMWTAYHAGRHVIAITPLAHNWVVKVTADEILPDLDALLEWIENGRIARIINEDA